MTVTPPTVKALKPGQALFNESDVSTSIFIIKKGAISLRKKKGQGHVEIAKVLSNEVLGELSFFDRRPRSASAIALIDSEVLEISFESLDKIYSMIPDYMKTIMASMAERLRRANEQIVKTQQQSGD